MRRKRSSRGGLGRRYCNGGALLLDPKRDVLTGLDNHPRTLREQVPVVVLVRALTRCLCTAWAERAIWVRASAGQPEVTWLAEVGVVRVAVEQRAAAASAASSVHAAALQCARWDAAWLSAQVVAALRSLVGTESARQTEHLAVCIPFSCH